MPITDGKHFWDSETEYVVSSLFRDNPMMTKGSRCAAIRWFVRRASTQLGNYADIDKIAAAVSYHMPR